MSNQNDDVRISLVLDPEKKVYDSLSRESTEDDKKAFMGRAIAHLNAKRPINVFYADDEEQKKVLAFLSKLGAPYRHFLPDKETKEVIQAYSVWPPSARTAVSGNAIVANVKY